MSSNAYRHWSNTDHAPSKRRIGAGLLVCGYRVLIRAFGRPRLSGAKDAASDDSNAQIYRAAKSQGGRLTVSDVVIETGLSAEEAKRARER